MTDTKTIRNKIVSILQAAETLKTTINKVLVGEPPRSRYPKPPFIFVEWSRGSVSAPVGVKKEFEDVFYIVVIDRHLYAEKAEDSVETLVDTIQTVLDADRTLDGTVASSWYTLREKQKVFEDSDFSLAAARITLFTRRRE